MSYYVTLNHMLDVNNSMPIQMHVFFLFLLKCIRYWCQLLWIYLNENIWKFLVCLWMRSKIWSKTPIKLFCISWIFLSYYCPSKGIYMSKCDNYKTIIPVAVHVLNYDRINSVFFYQIAKTTEHTYIYSKHDILSNCNVTNRFYEHP